MEPVSRNGQVCYEEHWRGTETFQWVLVYGHAQHTIPSDSDKRYDNKRNARDKGKGCLNITLTA